MKTNPTAHIIIVTSAKERKSPTGRTAKALNTNTVRASTGRLLRYCPSRVFISCDTCEWQKDETPSLSGSYIKGHRADLLQPLFYNPPSSKKCVLFFFRRLSVWCFTANNLTPLDCSHVHLWQLKFPLCSLKILRERLVKRTDILAPILAPYSAQPTPVKNL